MKRYLFYIPIILFVACSNNTEEKQSQSELAIKNSSKERNAKYKLIKDNLYSDGEGNLYLKSKTQEYFYSGKWINVWLKEVNCDTCWTPTEDGVKDISELKDFVDKNIWQYDTSNGYWTEYIDKNNRYRHTHMADGGTIRLDDK